MEELELILHNVGHGLAASLIEYPEKYVVQVDLGSEGDFSPLKYLSESRRLRPDILYITHPYADHLSDIENVYQSSFCPDYMQYADYDWDDVIDREKSDLQWIIKKYRELITFKPRGDYRGKASLQYRYWKPDTAKRLFGETSYVNNSSLFIIYQWQDFKIAITGDLETSALEQLLADEKTCNLAKGTYILIAPHHGHESGYTSKWPSAVGKPHISLISVQSRDSSVAIGYYSSEFARGVNFNGRTRYSLTTRTDGTIVVKMFYGDDGKPKWRFSTE